MITYNSLCSIPYVNYNKEIGRLSHRLENDMIDYRMSRVQQANLNNFRSNPCEHQVTAMNLDSIDQSYLLCGRLSGKISIGNLRSEVKLDRSDHNRLSLKDTNIELSHRVNCCQFYPNSQNIMAAAGAGKNALIWDLNTSTELGSYAFRRNQILDMSFGNNGTAPLLALACNTFNVYVENVALMQRFAMLVHPRSEQILCLQFNANYCYTGSRSGVVYCWDMRNTSRLVKQLPPDSEIRRIMDLKIAKNHGKLVAMTFSRRVLVWDLRTNEFDGAVWMSDMRMQSSEYAKRFDINDLGNRLWVVAPVRDLFFMCGLNDEIKQQRSYKITKRVVDTSDVNVCLVRQEHQQVIFACEDKVMQMWMPKHDEITERHRESVP